MKTLHLLILIIVLTVVLASVNAAFAYDIHPLPTQALYMKSNSVGHMYMKFNTYYNNQTIKLGPMPIYDVNLTNHIPLNLTDLSIVPNQTSISLAFNSTVIDYTVTARNNLTGIFALQLEQWDDMAPYVVGSDPQKIYQERQDYAKCTLIPFVVGLDMSQIDKDVLSKFVTFKSGCSVSLVQKHLVGIESIDSLKTSYLPSGVKQDIPVPIPRTISPLQQFKSGIPADEVKCNDGFLLTFKTEDGSPACVKPETAKKLYEQGWALVLTVNIKNNNANQTLVIGTDTYDVREFQPISGNAVYFDDMRFVYQGRSPLNNSCYPEIVNQTQARDFEIVSNDADFNSHSCWPPSNYPQNITKQNVLPSDLFSRYSISFFNNQTMGIGLCHVNSCEFGKMIYLAKRGWDTSIVYDSVSNLEFHLFTNASTISTGQSIDINMSTINKAQNTIIVPNKYDFSFNGTGLGPCYYGPFELEILRGYFDENNFTHGTELHMYQPGIYSCPAPEGAKGYKFEPLSDISTPRCSPFNYCNNAEQMRDRVSFSGYWNDTDFHKFESGMYTIIAGDEWGNHSIKHFTVIR